MAEDFLKLITNNHRFSKLRDHQAGKKQKQNKTHKKTKNPTSKHTVFRRKQTREKEILKESGKSGTLQNSNKNESGFLA